MKNYNNTMSLFNGNNKRYELNVPTVYLIDCISKEIARKHFERNTGLKLISMVNGYKAQPKSFKQIVKMLATYNYTTQYINNTTYPNTLFLYTQGKSDL